MGKRRAASARSLIPLADGLELDVDLGEPAQDERGLVDIFAGPDGPVLLFADGDVGHPVENALDRDPPLHARQRGARAGVDAAAERDVLADILAVERELVRILEALGIAVGGTRA